MSTVPHLLANGRTAARLAASTRRSARGISDSTPRPANRRGLVKLHDGSFLCGRIWFADGHAAAQFATFLDELRGIADP